MTQVCIIGDGAIALAVADVISKGRAPDGGFLEARIVCESLPQGMSCDEEYTGAHKHPDLQGYLHSAVGKVKGLRHTLRQAKQQEASSALSLMSGLEAAATGLTHIDQREVLTRENIHIESLNTFEREAESEVLQAFVFTCPATAYGAYLERMALAINDGCIIVLLAAPPFAALEVKHRLSTLRPGVQVDVIEVDEIFASVEERDGNIHMVSPARRVNVAGATLNETRRAMWLASLLCREIIPASNVVERALLDAHSILRPGFLMAALLGGRMDSSLSDVSRLLNRANLSMFVEIEQELSRVASVARCQPVDLARSLREEIDVKSASQGPVCDATLAEAIVTIAGKWFSAPVRSWSYNRAQDALCLYVSDYLVPLSQLGDSLDVGTPVIDSLISMASAVTGQDLRSGGRTFATIGLEGIKGQALLELMEN